MQGQQPPVLAKEATLSRGYTGRSGVWPEADWPSIHSIQPAAAAEILELFKTKTLFPEKRSIKGEKNLAGLVLEKAR
jgi:hypothetical protein